MVVSVRRGAWRTVGVQQYVLARICVAQSEKCRGNGASAREVHTETDLVRSRSVSAKGPLERRDYVLDGSGRRLREKALNQLHLRVRCDIPALVCKDVQSFMTATHRELSVVAEKAQLLAGDGNEIPEIFPVCL